MRMLRVFGIAWLMGLVCLSTGGGIATADETDDVFNDPMLRSCLYWLLTGTRGALIEPLCTDEYQIPPPSLFQCARKISAGFQSQTDLEACAIIFDEQGRKARSGFVRHKLSP